VKKKEITPLLTINISRGGFMKKYVVMQEDKFDCGAASLASIIKYYGGSVPLEIIKYDTLTKNNGTNFYYLKEAALKYGFIATGYKKDNLEKIKENAKLLNIQIEIFDTDVFEVSKKLNEKKPCYLCARMRRGYLYDYAKKLGCNKIALGHHFSDVIETTLLSVLYGAEFKTMMPKLKSTNYKGMELIRPLYLIHEDAIISWTKHNELKFLNCSCEFAERESDSKRKEIKNLIKELKKTNKFIEYNIFKSTYSVNLKTIISYKKKEKEIHFLDKY